MRVNLRRAVFVLAKIHEITAWETNFEQERDSRWLELAAYLCEVRERQCWRVDNLKSFDEFLEKTFSQSRRKAYDLMAIHEQLPRELHWSLNPIPRNRGRTGESCWPSFQ